MKKLPTPEERTKTQAKINKLHEIGNKDIVKTLDNDFDKVYNNQEGLKEFNKFLDYLLSLFKK